MNTGAESNIRGRQNTYTIAQAGSRTVFTMLFILSDSLSL